MRTFLLCVLFPLLVASVWAAPGDLLGARRIVNPADGSEMILIPAGGFWIGSGPKEGEPDERPRMAGNVWEWCADWYDKNSYQRASALNPQGAVGGKYRMMRGGAWNSKQPSHCRNTPEPTGTSGDTSATSGSGAPGGSDED